MAMFAWEAKTKAGQDLKGEMEASSQEAVISTLESRELIVGKIKQKGKGMDMSISIPGMGGGVDGRQLSIFTRQFSTMIDAGLPLVQCLDILAKDNENPVFKKALFAIKDDVEGGATFADGLSHHPKIFDNLFVNLVAAGEVGGILDTILTRLAEHIEKSEALKKQIKGAMVYPVVVLTIAFAIVAVLLIKVIPVFAKMFADLGQTLPSFTLFVMGISNWAVASWWKVIVAIVLFIIGYKALAKNPKGRIFLDSFYMKLPVFGNLIQKTAVARFTRTMGTMISSGVPILDALEICAKTSGNKIVEFEIMRVRSSISEGKTLSEPLQGSKVFPPMVVQMINVGEQTGALDAMLEKIADFYDMEVDTAVDALTSLMEPFLIVFLGTVVGGIAIAMYLPIFSIAGV